ncbi:MAG: hypothetical protein LAN18_02975 [Acidobacteriia bacterium]|nr:hypothetical protein [Terriglobia bacterium]
MAPPDAGPRLPPETPEQKQKTPIIREVIEWLRRCWARIGSAMGIVERWLQPSFSALHNKLTQTPAWLSTKPTNPKGEKFGLTALEASLVLILFSAQVALPMMGVQQNFWGAVVCWIVILLLAIRIVWKWETTKRLKNFLRLATSIAIVGVTLCVIWGPMTKTFYLTVKPSFIFLVPTEELVNCERRAFVVKHIGKKILTNVDVTLLDNDTNRGEVTKYPEIAPGAPDPMAPKYIWWSPSHPWFEDYTITAVSGDMRISQRLIVRSTQKKLQLASEVSINGKPEFSCRDPLLPSSYTVALDAREACESKMSVSQETKKMMELGSSNYQLPNGDYKINTIRTLSAPPGVEGQSENRHIWEYQRIWMVADLSKYPGTRVLLLASDTGADTWKYAQDLRDTLRLAQWSVDGPQKLPAAYDGLLDIQVSRDNVIATRPEVQAVMNTLTRAGVKHRTRPVSDPDIGHEMIVVFIGSRSPDAVNPDDCAGVPFKADKITDKPCAMIAQTTKMCRFTPP